MWLHIDVVGAEELLRPIAREVLGDVDDLAAAVVAATGIALGIFAGQDRSHRLEHGQARVVLAGDQLQVGACARLLVAHDLCDLWILPLEWRPEVHAAECSPRADHPAVASASR
jgi:hypothetical protein